MNLTEVKTIMLPWPQVSDILSECSTRHLGHEIVCNALAEGDDYWSCQLKGYKMPLPELCTLMYFSGLPSQEWDDTLPDEGGSTVDGFGMHFCDHLLAHHLGLNWKYRIIGVDGLWLVGVYGKKELHPEPVLMGDVVQKMEKMVDDTPKAAGKVVMLDYPDSDMEVYNGHRPQRTPNHPQRRPRLLR